MEYTHYLTTLHWRKTKHKLFLLRQGKCQKCGYTSVFENYFDGHHKNYDCLWKEDIKKDLLLLCNERARGCHFRQHRIKKGVQHIRPSDIIFWILRFLDENYSIPSKHLT